MGLFTPKYPEGAEPPKKQSRAERKSEQRRIARDVDLQNRFDELDTQSRQRSQAFMDDFYRRNPGTRPK
ncbi:hypothetical protein NLX86_18915 [Streptomyces sp. A3M-1-3]|uniref:hypothetical protein n=1 Tax=Streptomyces sp. A3M-1-3 TaxID=2962044 RepID=UPI0020B67BCA|nr:hypothetical protein [Streptomyces sp. A3M-1-3]MCP3820090.1 hypothetical protein [Streptomyces sp. A3M-1-3]